MPVAAIMYMAAVKTFGARYGYCDVDPSLAFELRRPPTSGPRSMPPFAKSGRSRRARVRNLACLVVKSSRHHALAHLFSGLSSATTHLVMATLLLIAPPKTCHRTATGKLLASPYPVYDIPGLSVRGMWSPMRMTAKAHSSL